MADRFDLAIVGSGGAGFAAAIAARRAGGSVVMVERGTVGETCQAPHQSDLGGVPVAANRHVLQAYPADACNGFAGSFQRVVLDIESE